MAQAGRAGADVVVNLNASPYNRAGGAERVALLRERVAEAGCAVVYVNHVGGQDELVFDGDSLVRRGRRCARRHRAQFDEPISSLVDLPVRAPSTGAATT